MIEPGSIPLGQLGLLKIKDHPRSIKLVVGFEWTSNGRFLFDTVASNHPMARAGGRLAESIGSWKPVSVKELPLYLSYQYRFPMFEQLLKGE
jgi:hypothetical protein